MPEFVFFQQDIMSPFTLIFPYHWNFQNKTQYACPLVMIEMLGESRIPINTTTREHEFLRVLNSKVNNQG